MTEEEESKRVSVQVSSLSTQLIESIDKQSHLEEQLLQARKVISSQRDALKSYESVGKRLEQTEAELESARAQNAKDKEALKAAQSETEAAKDEVSRLNKEVEELTASLFDEANNMVADARKETHSIQVKNIKLTEQLQEKSSLLETLEIQLKNLKKVLYDLEEESNSRLQSNRSPVMDTSDNSTVSSAIALENTMHALNGTARSPNNVLFSPVLKSLRYDLNLYNEFLKFIAALPTSASIKDTASESKLLRRLVHDEIQPLLRLDNASGLGWYLKRSLMALMMDGLVVVEPVSGINETYRVSHASGVENTKLQRPRSEQRIEGHLYNYPADSPPVAIQDPCSFCSESRNDILEHGRLYVLRTLQKTEEGTTEVNSQFPLCHYCLLKVRQTCEIFAFLRSLKSGAWHLESVTVDANSQRSSTEFKSQSKLSTPERGSERKVKPDRKSKRLSIMAGLTKSFPSKTSYAIEETPGSNSQVTTPTTNIQIAWAQLCKLRSTLHWTHIGIWSIGDSVETKLGPMTFPDSAEAVASSSNEVLTHSQSLASSNNDEFDFEKTTNSSELVDPDVHEEKIMSKSEVSTPTLSPTVIAAPNELETHSADQKSKVEQEDGDAVVLLRQEEPEILNHVTLGSSSEEDQKPDTRHQQSEEKSEEQIAALDNHANSSHSEIENDAPKSQNITDDETVFDDARSGLSQA